MKEQPTLQERLERRFREREDARIQFPKSQEEFVHAFPELAMVWEEWFPRVTPKLTRSISGNLLLIEDAGGWGELLVLVERHRVARMSVKTESKYENGRRHSDDEAEEKRS